jgi:hypothetical protein
MRKKKDKTTQPDLPTVGEVLEKLQFETLTCQWRNAAAEVPEEKSLFIAVRKEETGIVPRLCVKLDGVCITLESLMPFEDFDLWMYLPPMEENPNGKKE